MKITTNHQPRLLLDWEELTPKEQEFHDWPEADRDTFFRYKGHAYPLSDFTPWKAPSGWDGVWGSFADSAFSGVLVQFLEDDPDRVIVARFLS